VPSTPTDPAQPDRPPAASWREWLRTPRGQIALALLFYGLTEALTLPVLVLALVVLPLRDGQPLSVAAPTLFWLAVALVILIPALTAGYILLRLRQTLARAERRGAGPDRAGSP
jgi:hypothetical protein